MRIALVSPYSWTFPGGVTRHIDALGARAHRLGPPRARAGAGRPGRPHRRAPAPPPPGDAVALPDYVIPLGRTLLAADERRGFDPGAHARDGGAAAAASCAPAGSTSCTCTSRSLRWSGGTPPASTALRWSARSTPTRRSGSRTRSRRGFGRAPGASTSCTPGSPCPRPPAGPASATSAGDYEVIPNGVDLDLAPRGAQAARPTASGSCSSAARRSARACRPAVRLRRPAPARPGVRST